MIRGEKVDLVAPSERYIDSYHRWVNDPDVVDMLGFPDFHFPREREEKWIEEQQDMCRAERGFTILTRKGKAIGNIALMEIDFVSGSAILGIMIGEKDYWDRGYGADAINTALRVAFEEMGLRRVSLTAVDLNERALACYEKCGFVAEGRDREAKFHRGEYRDFVRMSILRREWTSRRKPRRKRAGRPAARKDK
ncbi:MAG: GNAT family N-acetyltransferase [Methanobacteriota archaeon]|nr:MAG: GNAT family N-acetyltransferase [Euryarchaeota archaeon]